VSLVNKLQETQQAYQLDRLLLKLKRLDLLILDALGYFSFSLAGGSCCSRASE
jgi:DNA replication protein DnaC